MAAKRASSMAVREPQDKGGAGATVSWRGPQPLAERMGPLVRAALEAQGFADARLALAWPRIVGDDIARLAIPVRFTLPKGRGDGGTLTLAAPAAAALMLRHRSPQITERIAAYFGKPLVARLRFETATAPLPAASPAPVQGAPAAVGAPLPPIAVADPALRAALESLARTLRASQDEGPAVEDERADGAGRAP